MNNDNLRKPQSTDEAREWGHNGGVKSGEARRERKAVRAILEMILSMPIESDIVLKDIKKNGLPMPENATYLDYVVSSIVVRTAKHGQIADLQKLIEVLGETMIENEFSLSKAIELLSSVDSVID